MRTLDVHTHLLSPQVRFDRLYDRIAVSFFARSLGTTPQRLLADPYTAYVEGLLRAVRESRFVSRICLFPVDSRVDTRGRELHRDRTVCSTTEDVLALHRDHPDLIVPILSVNPNRPDALERIDRYVEAGCRGAKLLQNYWGTDLNAPAYRPYFEKLAAHRLPVVIHVGSEYSIPSFAEYERLSMLRQPLDCGCTVIAAHMGLGRLLYRWRPWLNVSRRPETFDPDYHALLRMLEEEPNLYGDVSAILAPMRARALRHLSQQTQIHHKLLFGTDYPVPFTTRINSYDLPWAERRRITAEGNPFDRFAEALLAYFQEGSALYENWRGVFLEG